MNESNRQTKLDHIASHGSLVHDAASYWRPLIWTTARLLSLLDLTLRYHLVDPHQTWERVIQSGPVIFSLWHNRLALAVPLYQRFVLRKCPDRRLAALVSASRDGGLLAALLGWFDIRSVRGSSSRRAAPALLELTELGQRGFDLAITPDGPRGPRYYLREGILSAAQLSGLPIVPVGVSIAWKRILPSWDGFQVPIPFSRIIVEFGPAIRVPREIDAGQREVYRAELERIMNWINRD